MTKPAAICTLVLVASMLATLTGCGSTSSYESEIRMPRLETSRNDHVRSRSSSSHH